MQNELNSIFEKIRTFILLDIPINMNENEKNINDQKLSD